MKKLAGITMIILLISMNLNAQQKNKSQKKGSDFTTEQKATLGVKKMTLALDLTENQQKQVYDLMKQSIAERDAQKAEMKAQKQEGVALTSEQQFKMQNDRLDKQIAHKARMKNILTKDQYEKWERKMQQKNRQGTKSKQGSQNRKSKGKPQNQKLN